MPVYGKSGDLVGVISIDVTLNEMIATINKTNILNRGYSFLIDDSGRAIAIPDQGIRDFMGRQPNEDEFYTHLKESRSAFSPVLEKMISGGHGFESIYLDDRELYLAYAPVESTNWSFGSIVCRLSTI